MTNILAQFTNEDDAMTAFVVESNHSAGGFAVSIRDDDSGEFLPMSFHGIQSYDAAIAKARSVVSA